MTKPPNLIPSRQLNLALPLPLFTRLTAHLYSELECRVPHGAYSRFMIDQLRGYFAQEQLDLAPFTASTPGAFVVSGSPEVIRALRAILERSSK